MKQLKLLVIFLFIATLTWAQLSPSKVHRIQDATTLFGVTVAIGDHVTNLQTGEVWVAMSRCLATENLNTGDLQVITGSGLTNYSGQRFERDWPSNYTMTGTVESAFEYRFYTPPTISCGITGYSVAVEVGTSNVLAVEGSTTNPDNMTNGQILEDGQGVGLLRNFGVSLTYSEPLLYTPKQTPTGVYEEHYYRFYATQDYSGTETETATSTKRSIYAYYGTFTGISPLDYTAASGTAVYIETAFTKSIQAQATLTRTFNGIGYMYIITPNTWADISKVETSTGSVITGFTSTAITVDSYLLANDYIGVGYKCWISATQGTYTGQTFIITF